MTEQTDDPKPPTCRTCSHWDPFDDHEGLCLRFPPSLPGTESQVKELENQEQGIFPVVGAGGRCGEHPDFPAYLVARRAAQATGQDRQPPHGAE